MTETKGEVTGVNGNMVSARVLGPVSMNEVAYIRSQGRSLKSEIIKIRGDLAQMQVFEITKGIKIGDPVEFSGELLSVELGPGPLGSIYDGLQNPLPEVALKTGNFLEPGAGLGHVARGLSPAECSWCDAWATGSTPACADVRTTRPSTLGCATGPSPAGWSPSSLPPDSAGPKAGS